MRCGEGLHPSPHRRFQTHPSSFSEIFDHSIASIIQIAIQTVARDQAIPLISNISRFKSLFSLIDTTYKQTQIIEKLKEYIAPEEILLGTRLETVLRNGKMQVVNKRETFQYISIKKTLNALLNKKKYKR